MKKIFFLITSIFLLCCCQSKQPLQYSQKEQIDLENGLSVLVEAANILPTHLYTYNESIDGKLASSKRLHNTNVNDKYLFLEIVLDVKNTSSESLFVQDLLNFIIEENEVLYPGMLVEEGWKDGYIYLPLENKATSISSENSKTMRLYFWVPEEILESNLILQEKSNNIEIVLDISPIKSSWIELEKGGVIETDNFIMRIDDAIIRESQIQGDVGFTFYGLKVDITGKENAYLYLDEVVDKTFAYYEDKSVSLANHYQVIYLSDILTDNNVTGLSYNGKIMPKEKKEIIFGYTDSTRPSGFVFLKNKNIYYVPIEN